MRLSFLADENFNGAIVRGLLRRLPGLDIVTVPDVGVMGADGPTVVEWAANHDRILLTHDITTIPGFVTARVAAGLRMPGVFEVATHSPMAQVIDDLLLLAQVSDSGEWENQIVHVPL